MQWNVVFFGERNLTGSLKWMGAFWLSVAGGHSSIFCMLLGNTVVSAFLYHNMKLAKGAASSAYIRPVAVIWLQAPLQASMLLSQRQQPSWSQHRYGFSSILLAAVP